MKVCFMFPGQGSQAVGMGQDLKESIPSLGAIYEKAQEIVGPELLNLIFNGPEEELKETRNTQPAVFLTSYVCQKALEGKGVMPSVTAGNSLGEYNALVAAGVLKFEDALYAVKKRGEFMGEAADASPGLMAAIIGLDLAAVEGFCAEAGGIVAPALFNSPGQIVVSGEAQAVKAVAEKAEAAEAKKVVVLAVSGAWHSELMRPAEEKLGEVLNQIEFSPPAIPVILNVTGAVAPDVETIKDCLLGQLTKPVKWVDDMETAISDGCDTFIEVGPGRVCAGLMKRINREVTTLNVGGVESLEATVAKLSG